MGCDFAVSLDGKTVVEELLVASGSRSQRLEGEVALSYAWALVWIALRWESSVGPERVVSQTPVASRPYGWDVPRSVLTS